MSKVSDPLGLIPAHPAPVHPTHTPGLTAPATQSTLAVMTKLQQDKAASAEAFLADAGPYLADLCTACGACFRACPMAEHVGLGAADAKAVTQGLKELARGLAGSAETVAWVGACAKSGLCVEACPEKSRGLDAMLLVRIARQQALTGTKQLAGKRDPTAFPRMKTFARLQLTDEELKKWL